MLFLTVPQIFFVYRAEIKKLHAGLVTGIAPVLNNKFSKKKERNCEQDDDKDVCMRHDGSAARSRLG